MNLTIRKCEDHSGNFVVNCNGWSTGSLTKDEALGVVAQKLYSSVQHQFFRYKIPTQAFPKKDDVILFESCEKTFKRYASGKSFPNGDIEVYADGTTSETFKYLAVIPNGNWRLAV